MSAVTPGTLDVLREEYGLGSSVLVGTWANGARLDLFHPGVEPVDLTTVGLAAGSTVFAYHGSLTTGRGLLMLMDAFARVRATHPCTSLLLLGDGPAVPDLRQRAAALGLKGAVALVSAVPQERVPGYLAAVDVGVIPLPDAKWWRVQSPLKLWEYLAMGMTVIATDIEAHRAIDGVRLCPPTVAGLAEAMAGVIGLPPERVPVDVDRYSWDRAAERLSAFLQSARGA